MQFSLVMVSPEGGGYSGFQVMGMIEWGKNQNPPPKGLPTKPQKIPGPKTNPQKIPCQISEPLKFPESIGYTTKIKTLDIECLCLFIHHTISTYLFRIW